MTSLLYASVSSSTKKRAENNSIYLIGLLGGLSAVIYMFSFSSVLRTVCGTEKALNAESYYYHKYPEVLWVVQKGTNQASAFKELTDYIGWHMECT